MTHNVGDGLILDVERRINAPCWRHGIAPWDHAAKGVCIKTGSRGCAGGCFNMRVHGSRRVQRSPAAQRRTAAASHRVRAALRSRMKLDEFMSGLCRAFGPDSVPKRVPCKMAAGTARCASGYERGRQRIMHACMHIRQDGRRVMVYRRVQKGYETKGINVGVKGRQASPNG